MLEPVPDPEPVPISPPDPVSVPDPEPTIEENHQEEQEEHQHEETWNEVVAEVKACLPFGTDPSKLTGTKLLRVSETAAYIVVPDQGNRLHVERKLYKETSDAVRKVLGRQLDLQFLTMPNPKLPPPSWSALGSW